MLSKSHRRLSRSKYVLTQTDYIGELESLQGKMDQLVLTVRLRTSAQQISLY